MKKKALPFILIILAFLFTGNLLAMSPERRGTIRGTVYLDINGDGRCLNSGLAGEVPVPNIDLTFVTLSGNQQATLYSGSNGTSNPLIPPLLPRTGQHNLGGAPQPV